LKRRGKKEGQRARNFTPPDNHLRGGKPREKFFTSWALKKKKRTQLGIS